MKNLKGNRYIYSTSRGLSFMYREPHLGVKILSEDEYNSNIKYVKNLLKRPTPTKPIEGPIYMGNFSFIPRYKIKDFFENKGIKKTNCYDYAKTIVIDRNFLSLFLEGLKNSFVQYHKVYKAEKNNTINNLLSTKTHRWHPSKITKRWEDAQSIIIIRPINEQGFESNDIITQIQPFITEETQPNDYVSYDTLDKNKELLYDVVSYLIDNPHIDIIFDDELLNILNSDGIELTPEFFSSINQMLDSVERDNISLAFEMLSNVNLDKSLTQVAFLMNRYRGYSTWGARLGVGGNQGIKWKVDWKQFSYNLLKEKPEDIDIIKNYMIEEYNNEFKNLKIDLKIKDITLENFS